MRRIAVRVKLSTKEERVELEGDSAVVWVRAKPMDGEANAAVSKLLAEKFNVRLSSVRLVGGFRSKNKLFEIDAPARPSKEE